MSDLVDRLQGIYRIPITDGLGPVGSGEEPDNPTHYVRKHQTSPICHEAAARIKVLEQELAQLLAAVKAFVWWAEQRCPCHDESPDPCPLCGAKVEPGGGACKAADETLPPDLLSQARGAIDRASIAIARQP